MSGLERTEKNLSIYMLFLHKLVSLGARTGEGTVLWLVRKLEVYFNFETCLNEQRYANTVFDLFSSPHLGLTKQRSTENSNLWKWFLLFLPTIILSSTVSNSVTASAFTIHCCSTSQMSTWKNSLQGDKAVCALHASYKGMSSSKGPG